MQFRTKIITFAVVLSIGAAACATVTLALARGIERGMQSVTLAEDKLALYLTMEANVSDLLLLQVTAAAADLPETLTRLAETKDAVREDIDTIRGIALKEMQARDDGDMTDLERLDQIAVVLDAVDASFLQIAPVGLRPQSFDDLAIPLGIAIDAMDQNLAPLIDIAVSKEATQVILARNEIALLTARSARFGTAAGALTLLAAIAGVVALLIAFMRPFNALLEGAARLADGHLGFRIPEGQRDELGRLSRDFNAMAAKLERSDLALRAEEEDLQRRVAARTAELEAANARLADQDATRRRFLADVSHELRTPLTVMRGEAEVALRARDNALSANARESLKSVVEQSEHMGRLVDDLLFVARREAGEAPVVTQPVVIGTQLHRTLADARQLSPNATLLLGGEAPALNAQVEADPGRLHQLMMVLLDNALRYSPNGGDVQVEVALENRIVAVSVRDHGIGIPSDELPHVFDRFVRGTNALPGGTGLGLPVAKAIAEAHGGALTIESTQNVGTCVTLTLGVVGEGVTE